MAAAYCYEGKPLRFLASLFDIQMCYPVYMRYLWSCSCCFLGVMVCFGCVSFTLIMCFVVFLCID